MGIRTWYEAAAEIEDHVVRISTPRGSGTGFLVSNAENSGTCGVATAAHVINQAHYWEEPIRIDHSKSGKSLLVRPADRAVFLDETRDTAAVLFRRGDLPLPAEVLPLIEEGNRLLTGVDIAWLGFPAVSPSDLCFFAGKVSAYRENEEAYFVDGVAINGVSGGPAFFLAGEKIIDLSVMIVGVVSAYIPNRATGEVLPGLAIVRGVNQFHELAPTFESLDQAKSEESPPDASPSQEVKDPDATRHWRGT